MHSVAVIVSLALSVAGAMTTYRLAAVFLTKGLAVWSPDRLVEVNVLTTAERELGLSVPMFQELQRDQRAFSSVLGWCSMTMAVEGEGGLTLASVAGVAGAYFETLSVRPTVGSLLTARDTDVSAPSPITSAVLGYQFWQRHYGGRRDIAGRIVKIEGSPFTIVGVAPRRFTGLEVATEPAVIVPLAAFCQVYGEGLSLIARRDSLWVHVVGRLRTEGSLSAAKAEIGAMWPSLLERSRPTSAAARVRFMSIRCVVRPVLERMRSEFDARCRRPLLVLAFLSVAMLVVTLVNIGALVFVRTQRGVSHWALKSALGAKPSHMLREIVAENLLLVLCATTVAVCLTAWATPVGAWYLLLGSLAETMVDVGWNGDSSLLLGLMALLCVLVISSGPALYLARAGFRNSVRDLLHRRYTAVRSAQVVIIIQVAASFVVALSGGLLVGSLLRLSTVSPGYDRTGRWVAALFPRFSGRQVFEANPYYSDLLTRVRSIPGVKNAALCTLQPGSGATWEGSVTRGDDVQSDSALRVELDVVSPRYFETLGLPLLWGRDFSWDDAGRSSKVAVVSADVARRLFGSLDVVGREVRLDSNEQADIVGVAAEGRIHDVRESRPTLYLCAAQQKSGHYDLLVAAKSAQALFTVRLVVTSLGHHLVPSILSLDQIADRARRDERATAVIAVFYAALVLLLCAVGLYSLSAYVTSRRLPEYAVRLAVGASPLEISARILREAVGLVLVGILCGLAPAYVCAGQIESLLFGVARLEAPILALIVFGMLGTALLSVWIPARRARRVDVASLLKPECWT